MRHIRWLVIFLLAAVLIVVYTTGDFKKKELNVSCSEIEFAYYPTFEDDLIGATHIFFATFKGIYINTMDIVEYKFRVDQTLKGRKIDSIIYVDSSVVGNCDLERRGLPFKKGDKYLLVVQRERSLYNDHDVYYPPFYSIIPLDDLKSSTLFNVSANEFSNFNFNEKATVASLKHYIEKVISSDEAKNAPEFIGLNYTESNKLSDIVEASQYICQVKVLKSESKGIVANSERVYCEMVKPIYGDFKADTVGNTMVIIFIADTVKIGKEYIVLLVKREDTSKAYNISSKRSVRSVREYNRIVRLVDKLKE